MDLNLRRGGAELCQGQNSSSGAPLRASLRGDVPAPQSDADVVDSTASPLVPGREDPEAALRRLLRLPGELEAHLLETPGVCIAGGAALRCLVSEANRVDRAVWAGDVDFFFAGTDDRSANWFICRAWKLALAAFGQDAKFKTKAYTVDIELPDRPALSFICSLFPDRQSVTCDFDLDACTASRMWTNEGADWLVPAAVERAIATGVTNVTRPSGSVVIINRIARYAARGFAIRGADACPVWSETVAASVRAGRNPFRMPTAIVDDQAPAEEPAKDDYVAVSRRMPPIHFGFKTPFDIPAGFFERTLENDTVPDRARRWFPPDGPELDQASPGVLQASARPAGRLF